SCCAGLDSVLSAKPLTVKRSNNRGLLTGSITRINSAADFDGSVIVSGASGNYIAEAFGYDSRERVAENVSVDPHGVAVRENSTYSSSGLPLTTNTVRRAPDGDIEELGFVYAYDDFDRQTSVTTLVNGVEMAVSATSYDAVGRTAAVTMRDMRSEAGQTVGYSYITNGAVKSIATASGSMAMTLHYASGAAPSYSGNISGMEWKGADKVQRSYTYSYDGLNRLVAAQYAESGRPTYSHLLQQGSPDYSCTYSYDLNGNPLSVVRKGLTEVMGSGSSHLLARFGTVDNLTLKYSGNQVTKVSDSASNTSYTGASDFGDNNYREVEYEYDANGNMTMDFNRKIMGVVYNRINQPVRVEIGSGSFVENLYDADGSLRQRRLRQKAEGIPTIGGFFPADSIDSNGNYIRVTDYCGPWEYVNGKPSRTRIPGGYIEGDSVYFNITDHQGNIRQVWNATTGQTVQDNHYYPYGAPFGESASTEFVKAMARTRQSEISTNQYKYSAKEWMPAFGLNLYDFSARQYDPILCRFTSPDPLNFNYPQLSPYLYCAANPINYSDPTGLAAIYNSSGEHIGNTKEGFTGQIYIYDGSEKIDFSKYYEYQLSELDLNIRRLDDVATLLSTNAKLAIWNHIIAHFVGTYIWGERFGLDRINCGQIRYHYSPIGKNNQTTMWGTIFNDKKGNIISPPIIVWSNDFFSEYEGTIENIASTILVHEWYSHGIMHIGEENHEKAYENVLKYRSFWENTTIKYRYFVLNKMHEFKPLERKYKLTETLYINLIYKYGK
ncbi:MAG: RHS repeat-associated core domain-containing protein, partial [Muribaculaceae bacterium]|nr:RHS repeat-associated core domain-containing protein [Muribaculaceae bacterium]